MSKLCSKDTARREVKPKSVVLEAVTMAASNRRGRLLKRASIQLDSFLEDEEDMQFKVPKFQPLSTKYKKFEEKRAKEEDKKKLLKKPKTEETEDATEEDIAAEAERKKKLAELEKVLKISFSSILLFTYS